MIAIKAQPSTSSGLPASRQYSSADAVNMILNDSPPKNQFTVSKHSDSSEEIDTRVESPFNPSDATDGNPTGSLSATASLAQWLRRPPRERKIPGSNPPCAGIFSGSSHTSDFKIGTPVAIPCQAPGVIGSALGLVGPVSVYCDWVR